MAFFINASVSVRNAICDALSGEIDAGSGAGVIDIYTVGFGTLLVTLTFSDPSYAAASGGSAEENPITSGTVINTGTAQTFKILDSDAREIASGSVATSSSDLNFPTVAWLTDDEVSVTDFPIVF